VAWLIVALVLAPAAALAHGMRTAYVEISELSPGQATVFVRASVPEPSLKVAVAGCTLDGSALRCDGPLLGRALTVEGLGPILSEAVVDVALADGTRRTHLVRPDEPALDIASESVALQYVRLGVKHIATGADHLLFLLLLVLVLKRPRAVILAESAFTLSHSLSFTATALGWIHVSATAAEACIALSLVLVALDIDQPVSAAAGALTALVFGFVHGLGFAGGLREIGLPDHDVAFALLGFGAGVELGQIAFLAIVLFAVHWLSHARPWPKLALAIGYASGALASFWLIQRLVACWHGVSS
jgi:hypothetical protein